MIIIIIIIINFLAKYIGQYHFKTLKCGAMFKAVTSGHVAAETWLLCQASPCGICDG
jgi:hypothetical protein